MARGPQATCTKPRACTTRRPVRPNFFDSFVFPQNHPHGLKTLQYTLHNHQLPLQWCMARGHQATWMHHVHAPRGARLCPIFWIFFFFIKPPTWSQNIIIYTSQPSIAITMVFQPNFAFIFYFFNILIYKKNLHKKFSKNCVLSS